MGGLETLFDSLVYCGLHMCSMHVLCSLERFRGNGYYHQTEWTNEIFPAEEIEKKLRQHIFMLCGIVLNLTHKPVSIADLVDSHAEIEFRRVRMLTLTVEISMLVKSLRWWCDSHKQATMQLHGMRSCTPCRLFDWKIHTKRICKRKRKENEKEQLENEST